MTDDEVQSAVDQAIHEHREEKRERRSEEQGSYALSLAGNTNLYVSALQLGRLGFLGSAAEGQFRLEISAEIVDETLTGYARSSSGRPPTCAMRRRLLRPLRGG